MTEISPRDWTAHPPYVHPDYKSTVLRGPTLPPVKVPATEAERTGPTFGVESIGGLDADLTRNGRVNGEPLGERIIVCGRVLDEAGRAVPQVLVELWQCNAAGRYVHRVDRHDAPLDPNFFGAGRCVTDGDGNYRFVTIKPGAYPWGNHDNAWRPAHIHFSLFGASIVSRLVTQMYFPADPLLPFDPIYNGVPDGARERLVSRFELGVTQSGFALGYLFDIVLRGPAQTPME
jgi:protocatechuate 3,4-dioxygenase, beta subunit